MRADCFQGHVPAAQNRPFIVLFEQQCPDQPSNRIFIGEDAAHVGASLDFPVGGVEQLAPFAGALVGEQWIATGDEPLRTLDSPNGWYGKVYWNRRLCLSMLASRAAFIPDGFI